MRSAGEIKRQLQVLRFSKKLPLDKIAKDSRCTVQQVIQAFKLEASELILRRLDAYLDAGKLHVITQETKRAYAIERMSNELWFVWGLHTMKMSDVYLLSVDRQKRLQIAMNWRLKRALRGYVKEKTGKEPLFPDSATYWRCKAKVAAEIGFVAPKRVLPGGDGARSVVQAGGVHSHQDAGGRG